MEKVLTVEGLTTSFYTKTGEVQAVRGVSFAVNRGEILGIVGESGSGKSVTSLSILRVLPENAQIKAGVVDFGGRDILRLPKKELRQIRGGKISMIFQDPMTSLNPLMTVGCQVEEALREHNPALTKSESHAKALELLKKVHIPDAGSRYKAYPHEMSGGMRQRVMIAGALSCGPALVIADEPTTALDVTIQDQIIMLLKEMKNDLNLSVIFITHDLGVLAEICDRTLIMYGGLILEEGLIEEIFQSPAHPYTLGLMASMPRLNQQKGEELKPIAGSPPDMLQPPEGCPFHPRCEWARNICAQERPAYTALSESHRSMCWLLSPEAPEENNPFRRKSVDKYANISFPPPAVPEPDASPRAVLELEGVRQYFPAHRQVVKAVDGVSLAIRDGETFGLVGESGCGKSTLARCAVRLYEPTDGKILLDGEDITHLTQAQLRPLRKKVQMIFQDPYSSLNSRMPVKDLLAEPLAAAGVGRSAAQRLELAAAALEMVGLPSYALDRYPHEFSGGQRQRIGIARALILKPRLVICDEPISALDVSIQAQAVNMLRTFQREFGLAYLFIAHDLSMVRYVSHRVGVMYLGRLVEVCDSGGIYENPLHPYTQALLESIPVPDPAAAKNKVSPRIEGEMPSPLNPPSGCHFHPRCIRATAACRECAPEMKDTGEGHFVSCHLY